MLVAVKPTPPYGRWPSASLDRLCARRGVNPQAGTEKRRLNRTEKRRGDSIGVRRTKVALCSRSSKVRIKRRPSPQKDACQA